MSDFLISGCVNEKMLIAIIGKLKIYCPCLKCQNHSISIDVSLSQTSIYSLKVTGLNITPSQGMKSSQTRLHFQKSLKRNFEVRASIRPP